MSWTVVIMHLPEGAESFSDIPPDYNPPPLGTRDGLIALFKERFGSVDLSEPEWIKFGADVFPFRSEETVTLLTVRNPSEELLDLIVQHTDWKILHAGTGERVRWLEENIEEEDSHDHCR